MNSRISPQIVALILVVVFWIPTSIAASTSANLVVAIPIANSNKVISWNAPAVGPANLEHSPNLINWTTLSAGNSSGTFEHDDGNSIMGFYRLRWTPTNSATRPTMITVQGGTLPQTSEIAGKFVATFQIGKYEVTWNEWQIVRDWAVTNGYPDLVRKGEGSGLNHPARGFNWYEALKWCNALSEKEGLVPVYWAGAEPYRVLEGVPTVNTNANGYRLQTDAEWEWAARGGAGSKGFIYSGSNDVNQVAWHEGNSSGAEVNLYLGRGTWPVGTKTPNELGIHDMSGNAFEWVFDSYNPVLFLTDTDRRVRGGGWRYTSNFCAVDHRGYSWAGVRVFGFRVARNAQ